MSSFIIKLERAVDKYVFSPLCFILGLFKLNGKLDKKKVKKILVIRLWALGDSLMTLPMIDALKKGFPNAKIDVLAHRRNKIIFEGQKSINKIIDFGAFNILKNFRKYDLCIDTETALSVSSVIAYVMANHRIGFGHGIKSRLYHETAVFSKKQHMVQNYLDLARKIGIKYDTDKLVPVAVGKRDKEIVDKWIRAHNITKKDFVVGIAPGVAESVKFRMWPIEKVSKLADELIGKHDARIIFIDSKSNIQLIEKIQKHMNGHSINAAVDFGKMNQVKQSAELMKNCSIVVSNDSGPMHISAAMGVKTIGLFGPNTPVLWGPYGKNNISITGKKKGCPYMDNTSRELTPKHLTKEQLTCMDAITVEEVMKAVEKLKQK